MPLNEAHSGRSSINTLLKELRVRYFKLEDFRCRCGCTNPNEVPTELCELVDAIREELGYPILITSGYRCFKHNAKVGGALKSIHLTGQAADLVVYAPKETQDVVNKLTKKMQQIAMRLNPDGGVGLYNWGVHVDVRGSRARW